MARYLYNGIGNHDYTDDNEDNDADGDDDT